MILPRILHALTSAETWTNIGAFAVGWALAEVRAWASARLRLRRWERGAREIVDRESAEAFGAIRLDSNVFRGGDQLYGLILYDTAGNIVSSPFDGNPIRTAAPAPNPREPA